MVTLVLLVDLLLGWCCGGSLLSTFLVSAFCDGGRCARRLAHESGLWLLLLLLDDADACADGSELAAAGCVVGDGAMMVALK